MGFVDLHSHVLPGLDDGSPDPDTSMKMLAGLAELGYERVVATPHQRAGMFMPSADAISAAYAATQQALADAGVALALSLAAENMWDGVFYERSVEGTVPSYDGGPAFLVELPTTELPVGIFDRLFAFQLDGKLPVLAHPERYKPLWNDPPAVEKFASSCALVVDLGAVAGHHGRKPSKIARHLLTEGIAHAAASDAHNPRDITWAAEGIAWIRKKLGDAAATRLLQDNPRRILAGEHPAG